MPERGSRQFVTLVVLAMTAVLSPVSMDMLTPSLAGLSQGIGASPQTVELTLYSFLIGYGISPSFWGTMSDRFGRRPIMLAGMAIYSVSSLAGAMVEDAGDLIAVRFIQGIGGGAGATIARAIVRDIYGAAGTTRGMARMISLMAVVPFLMPLLGGLLASVFSWRACFIAMCLIGSSSVIAYYLLIPESNSRARGSHKPPGTGLISIVKNPVFAQYAICNMFCISILVIFGANFAFITSQHFDFNSATNGLVLALFNAAIAAGTYLAGWLMSRWGTRRSVIMGAGACTLGWLLITVSAHTTQATPAGLAPFLVLSGMGSGVVMALCSGAALTPFAHGSGMASSIYLLLQSAGSAVISLVVGLTLPKALLPIAAAMTACGCMAILSKVLLSGWRRKHTQQEQ